MGQRMTWEEMKKAYPDEWVAVVDYTTGDGGGFEGDVVYHADNKDVFCDELKKLIAQHGDVAMEFTGDRIKNPETPLLWQISHTV